MTRRTRNYISSLDLIFLNQKAFYEWLGKIYKLFVIIYVVIHTLCFFVRVLFWWWNLDCKFNIDHRCRCAENEVCKRSGTDLCILRMRCWRDVSSGIWPWFAVGPKCKTRCCALHHTPNKQWRVAKFSSWPGDNKFIARCYLNGLWRSYQTQ